MKSQRCTCASIAPLLSHPWTIICKFHRLGLVHHAKVVQMIFQQCSVTSPTVVGCDLQVTQGADQQYSCFGTLEAHFAGPTAEEPLMTTAVAEDFWCMVNDGHLDERKKGQDSMESRCKLY